MTLSFAYRRYSLPFRTPVRTAHGLWTTREGLFVRLENEAGGVGFGECAPIPWFGTETVDEAAAVCDALGASVDAERIAEIDAKEFPCLRFAFESAQASIAGRDVRAPGALPVAALLPAGRAALEKIHALAEAEFRTFKWKVGAGDAADELALLDDVVAALPAGARLRLDANGAWDRRAAERWLARVADYPVEFVEQPVASEAEDLLLGLAADYPTPLALDESVAGAGDVARWLDLGWPGIFVIKPSLLGDTAGALARLPAERAVFSSALETAVGAADALRVAFGFYANAAMETKPRAIGFGVWPLFADARFDGPRAAPFVRLTDVDRRRSKSEVLWNALTC